MEIGAQKLPKNRRFSHSDRSVCNNITFTFTFTFTFNTFHGITEKFVSTVSIAVQAVTAIRKYLHNSIRIYYKTKTVQAVTAIRKYFDRSAPKIFKETKIYSLCLNNLTNFAGRKQKFAAVLYSISRVVCQSQYFRVRKCHYKPYHLTDIMFTTQL